MKKTIYSDAILNFGKYKGKAVEEIMRSNPGYFAWLEATGNYSLDWQVAHCVEVWAKMNPDEAKKTRYSGELAKKKEESAKADESVIRDVLQGKPSVAFTPKVQNEAWGCW